MFWTRDTDSFNKFCELTVERRCKDPWFAFSIQKDFLCSAPNVIGMGLSLLRGFDYSCISCFCLAVSNISSPATCKSFAPRKYNTLVGKSTWTQMNVNPKQQIIMNQVSTWTRNINLAFENSTTAQLCTERSETWRFGWWVVLLFAWFTDTTYRHLESTVSKAYLW